jgi:hypothetical protein
MTNPHDAESPPLANEPASSPTDARSRDCLGENSIAGSAVFVAERRDEETTQEPPGCVGKSRFCIPAQTSLAHGACGVRQWPECVAKGMAGPEVADRSEAIARGRTTGAWAFRLCARSEDAEASLPTLLAEPKWAGRASALAAGASALYDHDNEPQADDHELAPYADPPAQREKASHDVWPPGAGASLLSSAA